MKMEIEYWCNQISFRYVELAIDWLNIERDWLQRRIMDQSEWSIHELPFDKLERQKKNLGTYTFFILFIRKQDILLFFPLSLHFFFALFAALVNKLFSDLEMPSTVKV